MKRIFLYIAITIVGAVVMIFELVGSRIIAPQFGNAIYVWTNIIGVVLASLSLGYYLGGKYADKDPKPKKLSTIILIAALLIALNIIIKEPILDLLGTNLSTIAGSFIAAAILFGPTSFLLGMVTPYTTRLLLNNLKDSGSTVGGIYAVSTFGSIVGTFGAGLILIPLMGSTNILYLLVFLLIVSSLLINPDITKVFIFIPIIFYIYAVDSNVSSKYLLDIDTQYSRILLQEGKDKLTGKDVLALLQDKLGVQSAMFKNSNELVLEYTKYFRLSELFNPDIKNALMIGGAAYSYPKDFIARNSGDITVVEIDPKVTEIAKKYFNLRDNDRMNIVHEDGRVFLNNTKEKYDVIMIDAFTSIVPPYQLGTEEAIKKESEILNKNGVIVINLVAKINSKYFISEYSTYKKVFNNVYVFPVENDNQNIKQNVILVATDSDIPEGNNKYSELLKNRLDINPYSDKIFTDDYSPIEFYASI